MPIARATDLDETEYARFLDGFAAKPGTSLAYHYPFYLRFLAGLAYPVSTLRFITSLDSRGAFAGVLPAIHVRTQDVNAWLSLAYFSPNAGALVRAESPEEARSLTRALVEGAHADARACGCDSITMCAPLDAPPEAYREALGGPDFEIERLTQCLALPEDAVASPWPRKVRYDIRRSASLGVAARPIADEAELDRVWDIYHRNCQDAGIPVKPREHVRELFRTAGRHGIFLLAEHGGEIVAGLICLIGGGVVSYYLPCTRTTSRRLQPGLLLLDRAVTDARAAGCRLLNFEASPGVESSVYQFKSRCGGTPAPYRVFVKLLGAHVLDKYRALGAAGLSAQVPHAFIVPFAALIRGAAE